METVLVVAVVVCSLLGAACCELFWIWLTGLAPLCIKRAYSRYFIRGVVKRKDKGMPFSATMIEPRLFLGSMPHEPEDLKALRAEHGVSAIVTMNEQWELPFYLSIAAILGKGEVTDGGGGSPDLEDQSILGKFCHLPTPDYCAPSQDAIMAGVAWITKQIEEADSRVYVHCNAGRGRSAVVVLCYLMSTHGWTAEEAFEFVLAKRQIAKLTALCGTRPQWRAVKTYEKRNCAPAAAEGRPAEAVPAEQKERSGPTNVVHPEP